LKRVSAHLKNAATSVLNPFHRIGFKEKKKAHGTRPADGQEKNGTGQEDPFLEDLELMEDEESRD
ncbi:MAG: hypothetical protein KJN92_03890, partial [Gemmatimonadetes bacterium]|nr:hypothetical protein [Gemmatimonadota bacterium]